MHTHLVYKLKFSGPKKCHEAQEALNVEPEASYLIQVILITSKVLQFFRCEKHDLAQVFR